MNRKHFFLYNTASCENLIHTSQGKNFLIHGELINLTCTNTSRALIHAVQTQSSVAVKMTQSVKNEQIQNNCSPSFHLYLLKHHEGIQAVQSSDF